MPDRRPLTGSPRPVGFTASPRPTGFGTVPRPAPPASAPPAPAAGPRPGEFDHDLMCGVLAGVVDGAGTTVTAEAVTTLDPATRTYQTRAKWLNPDDPLGRLARDCAAARQQVAAAAPRPGAPPWEQAKTVKARGEATARYRQLRGEVLELLKARGVLDRAARLGRRVLIAD